MQPARGAPSASVSEQYDEDPEVAYLMSKGYTREQALQVAAVTAGNRGHRSNSNNNIIISNNNTRRDGVEGMMQQGYSREQATQSVLQRFSSSANMSNDRNVSASTMSHS
ncbi:hypothetical protein EON64_18265 [archaeon]|nr:MAG: hypothetical protein EON64_18265 [archaeon]